MKEFERSKQTRQWQSLYLDAELRGEIRREFAGGRCVNIAPTAVIPVLVTGIQPASVCEPRK